MLSNEAVIQRIVPVAGFVLVDANALKVFKTGAQVFADVCTACHGAGVADALKFGDHAAWEPYIKTGMDAMVKVVMQGKPPVPPKGGAASVSEDDIRAAVQYMVDAAN